MYTVAHDARSDADRLLSQFGGLASLVRTGGLPTRAATFMVAGSYGRADVLGLLAVAADVTPAPADRLIINGLTYIVRSAVLVESTPGDDTRLWEIVAGA